MTGRWAAAVGLAVLTGGCLHAQFSRTDPSFGEVAGKPPPRVYVDQLPARPYRSVGIIEVLVPQGYALSDVMDLASAEGARVGCDVVVDRLIHRITAREPETRFMLAQYPQLYPAPRLGQPMTPYYSPPPNQRDFICGLWVEETPPPPKAEAL